MLWGLSDAVLRDVSRQFGRLYSHTGRPSIAPEKLLRALLLQVLYSVRSERLLMEQLEYNLLFRWFVGLSPDEPVWDATVFSKNRERLLEGDIAQAFFEKVVELAREHRLLSDEHFTVDGTLIEAWAGQKSFKKKDQTGGSGDSGRNPSIEFRGEKRTNETHQSTTDPEARLYKKAKGQEAKLSYLGHVLMENRNGLAVAACTTPATGTAERQAALQMAARCKSGSHLGADKAYDTRDFVAGARRLGVVPHVAQHTKRRRSAIDGRTTRHRSYHVSQWCRHRIEPIFGWCKTIGLMRQTRHRGVQRVDWMFTFTVAVYNLVRIRNLIAVPA